MVCFLLELAALVKKHEATFAYTNDDDGIHISVKGQEVFIGFLEQDAAEILLRKIK